MTAPDLLTEARGLLADPSTSTMVVVAGGEVEFMVPGRLLAALCDELDAVRKALHAFPDSDLVGLAAATYRQAALAEELRDELMALKGER